MYSTHEFEITAYQEICYVFFNGAYSGISRPIYERKYVDSLLNNWIIRTVRHEHLLNDMRHQQRFDCIAHNHEHHCSWHHQMEAFHRSPVNSPHKGQWRGALMFSLICAWTNGWVNNHEAGELRRHRARYDVTVMYQNAITTWQQLTNQGPIRNFAKYLLWFQLSVS